MLAIRTAQLKDRAIVRVCGADAGKFLQGLITNDMQAAAPNSAVFAGLLSPQGKILFEFFVVTLPDAFLLDVAHDCAAGLVKRLSLYRLRADAKIENLQSNTTVLAHWGDGLADDTQFKKSAPGDFIVRDPRHPDMGLRHYSTTTDMTQESQFAGFSFDIEPDDTAYHCHRITLGVPEGGKDYEWSGAYPHEALYDQVHGVSFTKGCFIGQEVVSRMQHRGATKKRIVRITADEPLPAPGTEITAGSISLGRLGSSCGPVGLALIRTDRLGDVTAQNLSATVGDIAVTFQSPKWATFEI
ncbi:MAG: folate-binding protein [Alphaproteobacteria bacterium]|nr:folate-binding protein [Alphaproteobacteria bacterium]